MREAVFSSLGSAIVGARVLDCFAGTGSYGLEALSRGAASVDFLENSPHALRTISENLARVEKSLASPCLFKTHRSSLPNLPAGLMGLFDIIFADPPYAEIPDLLLPLVQTLVERLTPSGIFVLECPNGIDPGLTDLKLLRSLGKKGKGSPTCLILTRNS